jgi:hypothetical protein
VRCDLVHEYKERPSITSSIQRRREHIILPPHYF